MNVNKITKWCVFSHIRSCFKSTRAKSVAHYVVSYYSRRIDYVNRSSTVVLRSRTGQFIYSHCLSSVSEVRGFPDAALSKDVENLFMVRMKIRNVEIIRGMKWTSESENLAISS